jgi:hypothetical protein
MCLTAMPEASLGNLDILTGLVNAPRIIGYLQEGAAALDARCAYLGSQFFATELIFLMPSIPPGDLPPMFGPDAHTGPASQFRQS